MQDKHEEKAEFSDFPLQKRKNRIIILNQSGNKSLPVWTKNVDSTGDFGQARYREALLRLERRCRRHGETDTRAAGRGNAQFGWAGSSARVAGVNGRKRGA